MEEIKLTLCKSPIKVYSNYAYILSVLLNEDRAFDWFYSNFIQVKYIRDTEECRDFIFNYSLGNLTKYFYNLPFLQVRSLERKFLLKVCGNITDFLCNAIREGYYIMTVVDNYYLPEKYEYNKKHNLHLIMLNGFSMMHNCFYSVGFNNGVYAESKVYFGDFYNAMVSFEGNGKNVRDDYCMLYKLQEREKIEFPQEGFNFFTYKFNKKLVKRSLQEYLHSVCSDSHFSAFYEPAINSEYGISYYEAMAEYVHKFRDGIYEGDVYVVAFHGMLEHKEVMLERLKYMQEKKYVCNIDDLIKEYEEVVNQAIVVRSLVLRYNLAKDIRILKRIEEYLLKMSTDEKCIIKRLIAAMN